LDETKSDEKRKSDARKRNGVAMANQAMSFTTESLMGMIYKAAVLTVEQRVKGDKLVLADLESAMHQHWRQTKANKDEDKSGN
jgi:hypothetical protein